MHPSVMFRGSDHVAPLSIEDTTQVSARRELSQLFVDRPNKTWTVPVFSSTRAVGSQMLEVFSLNAVVESTITCSHVMSCPINLITWILQEIQSNQYYLQLPPGPARVVADLRDEVVISWEVVACLHSSLRKGQKVS